VGFPTDATSLVDLGFKKLVIHQCSYSGLGTKSGGPLGGAEQKSKYPVDSRWSAGYLCSGVDRVHELLGRVRVTHLDFEELVKATGSCLLYPDPPYYDKGNDLYQCGFTEEDHVRLRDALCDTEHAWVLSYDKHERVEELYRGFADLEEIRVNYSITAPKEGDKRKPSSKPEYLITPRWLSWRLKTRVTSAETLCQ
jgi:DNA adenine methylase